jgi:phosphoribosyl 1,2-cyclic phosphodiesterase
VKVYFWGTRGSLPASVTAEEVRTKILRALKESGDRTFQTDEEIIEFMDGHLPFSIRGSYGTNTSCVEIMGRKEYILCDAGTGLRDFGNHASKSSSKDKPDQKNIFNIFISHLHWDHIQGFPFFTPAYIEGNSVNIYGCHNELEQAFINQQNYPYFPVPLKYMKADIRFITLESGKEYEIAGFKVKVMKQNHPGDSYGYRFERDGKSIVYSTDCEHKDDVDNEDYVFLDFFRDADLLIFDAQYELEEAIDAKENWGHSSNIIAVELSVKAKVKRLCIFHNEPTFEDEKLDQFLENTRRYLAIHAEESHPLQIDLAYDGLQIEL